MSFIVTVTKRTSASARSSDCANSAAQFTEIECFKQEFPDDRFNLSKFATELNRPVRIRKAKTAKPTP